MVRNLVILRYFFSLLGGSELSNMCILQSYTMHLKQIMFNNSMRTLGFLLSSSFVLLYGV